MSAEVGRWVLSYEPGDWLLLAGPTSALLLPPEANEVAPQLWHEVLESTSMHDLAAMLAQPDRTELPEFAAFFWGAEGMRSLVRGDVAIRDDDSGEVVAHGSGVQTWTETALAGLERVRVGEAEIGPEALPLVVGMVRASAVLLDAEPDSRVTSAQWAALGEGEDAEEREGEEEADEPRDDPDEPDLDRTRRTDLNPVATADAARLVMENGDTQLMQLPPDFGDPAPAAAPESGPPPGPAEDQSGSSVDTDGPTVLAALCPHGHPNPPGAVPCRVCGTIVPPQSPQRLPQPVLAVLQLSDGQRVALDRSVLVGRAPSAPPGVLGEARLVTVASPGQDISRTHVEVGVANGWQIVVCDLDSTNGTVLVDRNGRSRVLPPGERLPIDLGSVVDLGDGISIMIDFPQ